MVKLRKTATTWGSIAGSGEMLYGKSILVYRSMITETYESWPGSRWSMALISVTAALRSHIKSPSRLVQPVVPNKSIVLLGKVDVLQERRVALCTFVEKNLSWTQWCA